MKINNNTNYTNLTFDARLRLRGNVKNLTGAQSDYLRTVASQIGTSMYDQIDMFAHFPKPGKQNSLIDIAGYISKKAKATHTFYSTADVYTSLVHGLKYMIQEVFNNEIIEQFLEPHNPNQYTDLKRFIEEQGISLNTTNGKKELKLGKLTLAGNIDELSKEEIKRYSIIANAVMTSPHDELYMNIREDFTKENRLINIAAYFNGLLKSTLANYKQGEASKGMEDGLKFVIEQLHSQQIKNAALRNLNTLEISELNELLKKENINLQI